MNLTDEKPSKALIQLRKADANPRTEKLNTSRLSDNIDSTYAHAARIVSSLEEQGLVEREERGRQKLITLTDEGLQMAEKLAAVQETAQELGVKA